MPLQPSCLDILCYGVGIGLKDSNIVTPQPDLISSSDLLFIYCYLFAD